MKKLYLSNREVSTDNPAFIMGIINATPDSFFSESRGSIDLALKMIDEGADILDIGGESTRPGANYIDEKEEIKRIVPLIKEIRKHSDIPISVDTRKKNVFQSAFDVGADILNDVSALEDDDEMVNFCSDSKVPIVLMHKRGLPENMQTNTEYKNVFTEVNTYLESRIDFAIAHGIKEDKIIIDPGIGFGKNLEGNIQLIKNCGKLCDGKYPVLMALSRKTCIGQLTHKDVESRLYGTLAANIISVLNGAYIVRVHDCAPCVDTFAVLKSFL